jgi:hypothetical protein
MSQNLALGGNRLTRPRILRTGHPLTDEQIMGVAPAVFAEAPHATRGDRYAYVPTSRVLNELRGKGWQVMEVSQQRSRAADRDPYTKHMIRMRPAEQFGGIALGGEGIPEICVINAHDGTAAYHLYAGMFRYACSNGLIIGQGFTSFKVRHTIPEVTRKLVLENAEQLAVEEFPKLVGTISEMKRVELETERQYEMARAALKLRYGDALPPFNAEMLLDTKRQEDAGANLWRVFNRIQENLMYGGFETRSLMFNRRSLVRGVERVTEAVRINRGLWDLAQEQLLAS